MKVLFLTPWYPSERDAMEGLFVQKHVEAVRAQGVDVRVIYSQRWSDTWHQWKALQGEGWMPDVVQLNVIQKQGLLALWLKKRYGIPYVIIEHWSGYLPENGRFMKMSACGRSFYRFIAQEASMVLTVSAPLQQAMQAQGFRVKTWGKIDNVVDDFFFSKSGIKREKSEPKTLLHVSCFDEKAKNVKGLLRAAKMLSEKRQDWKLVLIGTGVDYKDVRAYADSLAIPDGMLVWTGELTPREVSEWMHKADAFVLSSRYETYGVVLAEAIAAGVAILSTPVGIAEEVADIIVPQEIAQHHPDRFAKFIETILWQSNVETEGKQRMDRFRAETVGKKLKTIYEEVIV